MKSKSILFLLFLFFSSAGIFAQVNTNTEVPEAADSVSETLFGHILDSRSLDIFPFLSPITLPFGMTVLHFMLIFAAVIIFTVFALTFRKPKMKPGFLAAALESLVLFVRDDIVYPIMGEKRGEKWLPFFVTLLYSCCWLISLG